MKSILIVFLLFVSASFSKNYFFPILINPINYLPDVTDSPVFGVLNLKSSYTHKDYPNATHYIQSSYVKFLEMSGAQVVPIKLTDSYEEIDKVLKMINGVLFTGGDNPFWIKNSTSPVLNPEYGEIGCYIYEAVKKFNDDGVFFPLWGTCLGLELIHICENNEFDTISNFTGEPAYTQLNKFTIFGKSSLVFTNILAKSEENTQNIIKILETEPVSLLAHHFGISPDTYKKYPKLAEAFQILTTMQDLDGKEFVAMIESKKYPIYAVQFHPEVNPFDFSKPVYPHSSFAIEVSSYFSEFLVRLSRKNTNTFPSTLLKQYSIYNYPAFYDKTSRTIDFLIYE